jgi:hypothetical protein
MTRLHANNLDEIQMGLSDPKFIKIDEITGLDDPKFRIPPNGSSKGVSS